VPSIVVQAIVTAPTIAAGSAVQKQLPTTNRTAGMGTGGYVGIALAVFFTLGCIFGVIVFALRKNPPAGAKAGTAIAVTSSARTSAVSVTTDDKADDVVSGGRTFNDKI